MGEIMRWRMTRAPQRRVPSKDSTLRLDQIFRISSSTNNSLANLAKAHRPKGAQPPGPSVPAAFAAYVNILSDANALRLFVTTGSPAGDKSNSAPANNAAVALLQLDEWLAANSPAPPATPPYGTPALADLNSQIATLLGNYRPNSVAWKALYQMLLELYFAGLVLSAIRPQSLVDALGLLTRWLLVTALVDDLQQKSTTVQNPDDVYSALRWRTIILPDNVVSLLLGIRAQKSAALVRKPGFADLYITREEWDHYEAAEIASIENILGQETKKHVHVLVNQTQTSSTTDKTITTVNEQDTTTTDLSQLQQQSTSDVSIAAQVGGQVSISAQYGTAQINAQAGGSLEYSNSSSTSRAQTQSHETVSRAISKIEQTTRTIRTVSTLTREKDTEEHNFSNPGSAPVVGIYRWVDQIQNIELDRYPHRFLMEFEIPEPGAWTRWLHLNDAADGMLNKPPVPFTLNGYPATSANPLLSIDDIDGDSYATLVSRYMASGVTPPPGDQTVAVNLAYPSGGTQITRGTDAYVAYQSDSSMSVPNNYKATDWTASVMYSDGEDPNMPNYAVDVVVGAGVPQVSDKTKGGLNVVSGTVGPISQGGIPVSVQAYGVYGFEVNVEVHCVPLPEAYKQWQSDTFGIILGGYNTLLLAYNDEKAGLSVQQTNPVDANSPAQNAQTITQELKRQTIEMLTGVPFAGFNAINWDSATGQAPTTKLATAASIAPEIQFLEQAFEWDTMTYICYPFYWADSSRWSDLAKIKGNDSNFADFLRSGSARVVLAARPGFEDQVNFYLQFGILWGGGPVPAPGDPNYLSIADEIKAMQQGPLDATVIDTWQVRLPTTLIWLENPDGLPKNPSPTIDTIPRITGLSSGVGSVGDKITIFGTNFGDLAGASKVYFNNVVATQTRWSYTSIDVTVPTTAITGNVSVTVYGVASNGMPFKVQ